MLTHECKGNASYKHLSIKQENIDLYYKNKPRIFATVPQSVIEDKSDGSTKQKELSTKTVKSYLVPLPPMDEQKRNVEKVEELTQILK